MRISLLRNLLMLDAAVLFLLGALLIFAPRQVEHAFKFSDLPEAVSYLIGLWGCVFVTMGWGYVIAASNPLRHRVWIQVAIGRGILECGLGLLYLGRGIVTFSQAGLGIILAGVISAAYIALYPRGPRLIGVNETTNQPTSSP
jgi:hypothetical protein